jgi:8-oxo-dGTP pyrophosphatase MutT (NUDIX family)
MLRPDQEAAVPSPDPSAPLHHGVLFACRRAGDGRWLLIRRGAALERAPGKVGFPGGEVHPGESQAAAVVREAWEELGIEVRPARCVWRHEWPDRPWVLFGWLAEWRGGAPRPDPDEVAEVLWLREDEALRHPDAVATLPAFFEAIRAAA